MTFRPVRTAVIGCGMISDIYLQNCKNTFSILDLCGCADMVDRKAAAQAEKYGIRKMTTEEILADDSIELVLNLTYPTSHYEVSRAILSAGKHCYCEKMMALTMAEADELMALAKEKGVMFAVAPDTFLGASQQTARYVLDRGLIGAPIAVVATLSRGYFMIKEDKDDAVRKYSVMCEGGGIPYDMGGYYLHEMFNLFGPVRRVCGFSRTREAQRPFLNPRHSRFGETFTVNTPNTMACSFEFASGVYGMMYISSEHAVTENRFTVMGSEGHLELGDPNNFGDKIYITKNGSGRLEFPLSHPYAQNSRGIGAADMAWALRTGRPARLSPEMGYHAMEFITAVAECDRTGEVQTLHTTFARPAPISPEYYNGTSMERSLYLD